MTKGYRQGRIGEEIRKIISDMLLHGLKDPRLDSLISITAVEVSGDNSYATVYFSTLDRDSDPEKNKQRQEDTLEAFNSAKGFIRNEIGRQLKLRHTPELVFKYDHSMEYSSHIEELLNEIK